MEQLFCIHDRQLVVQPEQCMSQCVPLLRSAYRPQDWEEWCRSGAGQEGIEPPAQLNHTEETSRALRLSSVSVCMCEFSFLKIQPSELCFPLHLGSAPSCGPVTEITSLSVRPGKPLLGQSIQMRPWSYTETLWKRQGPQTHGPQACHKPIEDPANPS